jgi:hypothetical protein
LCRKRETHSLTPSFSTFDSSGFFILGFVKDTVYHEKCKMNDSIFRAGECITNKMLAIIWRGNEYHLDVFCATMVPILRCTEHIRNFIRPRKCINFSNTLYGPAFENV